MLFVDDSCLKEGMEDDGQKTDGTSFVHKGSKKTGFWFIYILCLAAFVLAYLYQFGLGCYDGTGTDFGLYFKFRALSLIGVSRSDAEKMLEEKSWSDEEFSDNVKGTS